MDSVSEIERKIASFDRDIAALERNKIADLERENESLKRQLRSHKTSIGSLEFDSRYYSFRLWFRSPSKKYELWPAGVLLCGPLLVAVIVLLIGEVFAQSFETSLRLSMVSILVSIIVFAILLFMPKTDSLLHRIGERQTSINTLKKEQSELRQKRSIIVGKLRPLQQERDSLVQQKDSLRSSLEYQREKLLQRNWKQLRGLGWERYLGEVCNALGYGVEHTKASGDQGVDLVAVRGEKRIAIQAKGYAKKVSNKAVQEVVAGQRIYSCSACAVITNSSFTESAFELAAANRCVLIYDENFPDFVMGRLPLSQ